MKNTRKAAGVFLCIGALAICVFGCKNKEPDSVTVQTSAAAAANAQPTKGMTSQKPMTDPQPVDGGSVTFGSKAGGGQ